MQKIQLRKSNSEIFILAIMAVTGILITVTGIIFKQSFIRILPLYVSLAIALMQSRVSRYASLIGGFNAILYAITYGYYHLYASMIYAILVSCPLQIVTFVLWSKKPWKNSTIFRRLTVKQRIVMILISLILWVTICSVLKKTSANHSMLDTAITILGIIATVLTMLSYIEYTAVMLVSQACSIYLYILMLGEVPEQVTYLIYSVYALVCTSMAFVRTQKIYKYQQTELTENNSKLAAEV